ncbi:MAG: isochorismatase family protein [Coriobacteriia bacterium]|nr:isochorismatase family protein [Coriobacteriia bacterium]
MPANTVASRDDSVLVIVDEQERLTAVMERRDEVVSATVRLVRTAALVCVPIVVTRQYPKGLGDTDPTLAEVIEAARAAGAGVTSIDKVAFDCFGEPAFAKTLERSSRRQMLLAGMETHICVTQTALSALRNSFDVHVVGDACCSRNAASHDSALERMRAAGAVVTTTESVMYELMGESGSDEFRALLAIVKQ